MSNLERSLQRISDLNALFVQKVKNRNAINFYDINLVSEDFLVEVFREVYDYHDLMNLNVEGGNYAGIDLGDKKKRVAIQVTSNKRSKKIKDTLEKFVEHKLYEQFGHLIVYIITEKQGSYKGAGWDEIVGNKFRFIKEEDIWDNNDLLKAIRFLPLEKVQRVESIFELHLGTSEQVLFGSLKGMSIPRMAERPLVVPRINPTPLQRALIGREDKLISAKDALSGGHKIFFHGSYGVGKTSFTIELFSRASASDSNKFVDGYLWHTVRGMDVARVTELIAADFNDLTVAQASTDSGKIDALRKLLAARKQLLIGLDDVDNAKVAKAVLDSAGHSTVIFNGQRNFNLHGQAEEIKIHPLSAEQAQELFIQQAALGAAFLNKEELDQIQRICEQMHNLPLAVELAARKVAQGESLQTLETRLMNSPVTIISENDEVRAIFNEIYADLEQLPVARRLLTRLASFSTFEAPLAALSEDVDGDAFFEAKDKIVEFGLVSPRGYDRLALHALLGLLVKKQADKTMLAQEQNAVATWLINHARANQADYVLLAHDHQNFVGILDWFRNHKKHRETISMTYALFDYLRVQGHWQEAKQRLEEAKVAAKAQNAKKDQAWIGLAHAKIMILRGEYNQARKDLGDSKTLYDELGNSGGVGQVYALEGRLAALTGKPGRAIQLFKQAISLMDETVPIRDRADAHTRLANLMAQQGHRDEAKDQYELALTLSTWAGDKEGEAHVRRMLGHIARRAGSIQEAMRQYQCAIQLAEELGDKRLTASLHMENGYLLHKQGKSTRAEKAFCDALNISQQLEHDRGQARAHHALGLVLLAKKDQDAASTQLNKALRINQELGNTGAMAGNHYQLALLAQRQGKLKIAEENYHAVLQQAVQLDNVALQAACKHQLGRIALINGDLVTALRLAEEALAAARRVAHLHLEALVYLLFGRINLKEGNEESAWLSLNKAKIGMAQMRAPQLKNAQRLLNELQFIPSAEMEMEVKAFSSNFTDQIQETTALLFDSGDVNFDEAPEAEYEEYEERIDEEGELEEEEYEEEEEEEEEYEEEEYEEEEEEEE